MNNKIKTNYLPEIAALMFGRAKPALVAVNLTNQCNQNCIYCEIGQSHTAAGRTALTFEDLIWILDEMHKNKMHRIAICGGEPFLFDGLIDIIQYAQTKNIKCAITTNGMTIHKLTEKDLRIIKESETEINISIDSFDAAIQSKTRGTAASLPNALKSLYKLREYEIQATVLTVISKYNYQNLYKTFTDAHEAGVEQILFQPIIYHSNFPERPALNHKSDLNVGVENLDLLMKELYQILKFERKHKIKTNVYRIIPWIQSYLKTASIKNGKWFFDDVLNKFICREIHAIIDISYDGGIQPCGLLPATTFIQKNQEQGLMKLWFDATLEIKSNMARGQYYDCCNGCCHHFSRNMLASIFKHPLQNRKALMKMIPNVLKRMQVGMMKVNI